MKIIQISPEGTHFLFTLLFSLFTKGVLQHFAARPFCCIFLSKML